jgi:hypothetical protein
MIIRDLGDDLTLEAFRCFYEPYPKRLSWPQFESPKHVDVHSIALTAKNKKA